MSNIAIFGYPFPREWLSQAEIVYLEQLPMALPSVEWVWEELDRVWRNLSLDNRLSLQGQAIGRYYSHPVWLMNGVFTALDPASVSHRRSIARYLCHVEATLVGDFGGGFGELARAITVANPAATVCIVEPHPSRVMQEIIQTEHRIRLAPSLSDNRYDAIVAQDVLEHVEDPILLASEIAGAVRKGGRVIFANCFYPMIQCHLPSTFHLRHTFHWVMRALGLHYLGRVDGAAHAQVFERVGQLDFARARRAEAFSRLLGPVLNRVRS